MESVWFNAARQGNLSTIQTMHQQQGFDINSVDSIGNTALMWATSHEDLFIIEYLLNNNADVNIQDKEGYTALMYATMIPNTKIAKLLISKKSNLNLKDKDGKNALMWACQKKSLTIVKDIIKRKGISINETDKEDNTALHYACTAMEFTGDYAKDTEIVKLLVAKGINIKPENKEGKTALYRAVVSDKLDVVVFLLLCGAEVTEKIINASKYKQMYDLLTSWQSSEGEI